MLATVPSGAIIGLDAIEVSVEVDYNPRGMTSLTKVARVRSEKLRLKKSPRRRRLRTWDRKAPSTALIHQPQEHYPPLLIPSSNGATIGQESTAGDRRICVKGVQGNTIGRPDP
jgi:hypothetical protein